MKNQWFALYVADYLAKTSHLTQAQHGAYFLLMLHYYATEKPIHANAMQVHAICRCTTDAERNAANSVLQMFFTREEDFYRNTRIDEELAKRSSLRTKRQNAAQERWGEKVMQVHMQVHTQSQSQLQKHKDLKNKGSFVLPDWVPKETWNSYEEMRIKIRKAMTDRARELAVKQLGLLDAEGYSPREVMEQSIMNSWAGLFPLKDRVNGTQQVSKVDERTKRNREALLAGFGIAPNAGPSGAVDAPGSPTGRGTLLAGDVQE